MRLKTSGSGTITTRRMQKSGGGSFVPSLNRGVYAKIEENQMTSSTHFPANPLQAGSVVRQLKDRVWMKGILVEFNLGQINTGAGTYDWAFFDKLFSDIKNNAPTKKLMILIELKIFDVDEAARILPPDLRTTDGLYGDGTTIKYHYLWNYLQGTPGVAKGYHLNLFQFQDGLTGNDAAGKPVYTLRNRMYDAVQAFADRYANNPDYENIFAGVMTSESASLTQQGSFISLSGGLYPNSVNTHFKGRIAFLKKMKQIFSNRHMIMEDCNFNHDWTDVMCNASEVNGIGTCATDGLVANKIAFTQSNYHTGTNLYGWTHIQQIQGEVAVVAQAQGLDQDSKSGEFATYYNYPDNPISGWPDSSVTNNHVTLSSVGNDPNLIPVKQRPPDFQWEIDRANHFLATHLIVQHNYSSGLSVYGWPRYNWPDFAADMDASIHANDPLGGLDPDVTTNFIA